MAISAGFWTLARTAAFLGRRADARKGLPHLLFFTDPARTPDLEAIATTLPRGAGVVFRAFDAPDAVAQAQRLKAIARARGLILLIGADARLAAQVYAHGVHLPERLAHQARRLKAAHPRWIVTAAAHSETAVRRALAFGADVAVVSTVFASRSASAGRPIGAVRMAGLVRRVNGPVYGLGGIDNKKARLLKDTGLVGLAAVEGLKPQNLNPRT